MVERGSWSRVGARWRLPSAVLLALALAGCDAVEFYWQGVAGQLAHGGQSGATRGHRCRVDQPQPVGAAGTRTKPVGDSAEIGGLGDDPVGVG